MHNDNALRAAVEAVAIPNSSLTIGSSHALQAIGQTVDGLQIELCFGFPVGHIADRIKQNIAAALAEAGCTQNVQTNIRSEITARKVQPGVRTISGVKNIIAVASGKGGVGKSTTAANLAVALHNMGVRVGILDADLYGPSQPTMLGVPERKPHQALQQLLFQSEWDNVDYLFVDLPPGTGDIQLTLSQKIPVTGAIVVTTPQDIALIDARKAVDMFGKVNIPIFGVLENMSVHICSHCGHHEPIFGQDGGKALAERLGVPLLGQLPLSLPVREAMDSGSAAQMQAAHPDIAKIYTEAAWQTALAVAAKGKDFSNRFPQIVVE